MAYHSKYSGVEVDSLLDKIKDDEVGRIDSSLSTTSENPVKNKAITEELNKKANKTDIATINGQPLTNGGNIEVITDAYDDTEIKGKLTELDSQIEDEATARTEADAELQTQINGKQEALTLTVKDNGNIVLANIQGQSKEFMPATPSGDPMHYAYVAAGAEYNDTGADIVKTTPWADMIDDDYTGDYGKTVVHKSGYWYLNGLGDITNKQMRKIYAVGNIYGYSTLESLLRISFNVDFVNIRTNICNGGWGISYSYFNDYKTKIEKLTAVCYANTVIECLVLTPLYNLSSNITITADFSMAFYLSSIKIIIGLIDMSKSHFTLSSFRCSYLKVIKIIKLNKSIDFSSSSVFTIKSVLFMINNEAATSPITITLHADVYNKCMANADILAALEQHTNISLASA